MRLLEDLESAVTLQEEIVLDSSEAIQLVDSFRFLLEAVESLEAFPDRFHSCSEPCYCLSDYAREVLEQLYENLDEE